MSSMIPQAFVSTRIQPRLEPTPFSALLSPAVRFCTFVSNAPLSHTCHRRQTCETSVCRNAEHKVCSIVYRPRAPQETIAPMVRATRPPACRTRGPRFCRRPQGRPMAGRRAPRPPAGNCVIVCLFSSLMTSRPGPQEQAARGRCPHWTLVSRAQTHYPRSLSGACYSRTRVRGYAGVYRTPCDTVLRAREAWCQTPPRI